MYSEKREVPLQTLTHAHTYTHTHTFARAHTHDRHTYFHTYICTSYDVRGLYTLDSSDKRFPNKITCMFLDDGT